MIHICTVQLTFQATRLFTVEANSNQGDKLNRETRQV